MIVRDATLDDLPGLLAVHNYAVRELDAIWSEREETLEERTSWFEARTGGGFPVLVAVDDDGAVLGYGTFGQYRPKTGYRLTVEHSIYIAADAQGKGVGKAMLVRLIEIARAQERHVMVAVIDDQNDVSVKLHEKFGFEIAGRLPQSGMKHGRWLGQINMMLRLDDRDTPPGV